MYRTYSTKLFTSQGLVHFKTTRTQTDHDSILTTEAFSNIRRQFTFGECDASTAIHDGAALFWTTSNQPIACLP